MGRDDHCAELTREGGTQLIVDGETLGFHLEEKARREKYQPTAVEQKNWMKTRITVTGFPTTGSSHLEIYP